MNKRTKREYTHCRRTDVELGSMSECGRDLPPCGPHAVFVHKVRRGWVGVGGGLCRVQGMGSPRQDEKDEDFPVTCKHSWYFRSLFGNGLPCPCLTSPCPVCIIQLTAGALLAKAGELGEHEEDCHLQGACSSPPAILAPTQKHTALWTPQNSDFYTLLPAFRQRPDGGLCDWTRVSLFQGANVF